MSLRQLPFVSYPPPNFLRSLDVPRTLRYHTGYHRSKGRSRLGSKWLVEIPWVPLWRRSKGYPHS